MALVPVTIFGAQFTSSEVTFLAALADHTYTDGQLIIGNGSTGGVSFATLTQGSGVTITNGHGTITISAAGGSSGFQQPSGTVNGSNQMFVFATAPNVICVDEGRVIQKTSSDGTANWTGTTTVTLAIAPNNDIFGIA